LYDLEMKKISHISEYNYLEADKIHKEIEKLQKKKGILDKKDIEVMHLNELRALEERFTSEMEAVVDEYNKHFTELEKASKQWEEEVTGKQKEEHVELKRQLQDQLMIKFKSDKEHNSLVKQEEMLVKTLKFKEAHEVKLKREKLLKKNEKDAKMIEKTQDPLQKNKYHIDKLSQRHKNEKEMLRIKIEREIERIKKEKVTTLEQLHHKFKNRKLNLEYMYKKQISLQANPIRAKSSSYKAPRLKNNNSVFSKLSSIDNYSVHNTNNSKNKFQPEKINVNLNNISKHNSINTKQKNTYSVNNENEDKDKFDEHQDLNEEEEL